MRSALRAPYLLMVLLAHSWSGAEQQEVTVEGEGFAATVHRTAGSVRRCGVVVLGGAEGGKPTRFAEALAAEGYPTLALAYFKTPGTPSHLDEIPLEYVEEALAWFSGRPFMEGKDTILLGASKGAELALLLASRSRDISGVIAISPSSVVFQGIPESFWPPRSSWTLSGHPVPFVPYDVSGGIDPSGFRSLYERSLSHEPVVRRAVIPVEQINGPILLLSGDDDTMWPASEMAELIVKRLEASSFPHGVTHEAYPEAGHTLNEYYMLGGTPAGNQAAREGSWRKIFEFLRTASE